MEWTLAERGDGLEKIAASFIAQNIPAYEEIWKRYIGHIGGGKMASMQTSPSPEVETQRIHFSEHHYTILESLYFMQKISDEEQIKTVASFEDYRKTLNNIMAFQAYSGRLRDNIESCFNILNPGETKTATNKLAVFFNHRHVFVHGKKVPFGIDNLGFSIAKPKDKKDDNTGFDSSMNWDQVPAEDFLYGVDFLSNRLKELFPIVQGLLSELLDYVKEILNKNSLTLSPPNNFQITQIGVSGYSGSLGDSGSTQGYSGFSQCSGSTSTFQVVNETSGVVNWRDIKS